ncbi:MBL fold metallo-hydrolase [Clostridioides mangenotii]|uniref:MBL fold metallo-hydrolase n=1 Tax=Metaclostridioides mangenotii TaxID=1540 RepID=UPI00214A25F2|nr:MBL fold metallo-hydrolase [Clostridioides mangenotii]MCR1955014.1 MBL fold metallo-hydrolase [Clostridioides mangenotii]
MNFNKISERVFYLENGEETDRPLLGYIKGDKYSLMIDAGNSKNHVELFMQSIEEANLKLPDYVAITHWHWDHTFGMSFVPGKTIACHITNEKLKSMAKWKWTDQEMKKRLQTGEDIEFADTNIRKEYKYLNDIEVVSSNIVFKDYLEIDLGGIKVILQNVISPHSQDSVIAYVPAEKVVFIGDAYSKDFYNGCKYEIDKIKSLLNTLENLDFDICLLSHHSLPLKKEAIIRFLHTQC